MATVAGAEHRQRLLRRQHELADHAVDAGVVFLHGNGDMGNCGTGVSAGRELLGRNGHTPAEPWA